MKKLAVALGIFLALVLGAVVVAPLLVDVDRYRPLIAQAVNSKLRGTFELGRLKLSLWGRLRIEIGGLSLKTQAGSPVLKVSEASLDLPLLPILKGSPEVTLRMVKPELLVRRPAQGDWELLSLIPESGAVPPNASSVGPGGSAGSAAASRSSPLPSLVVAARVNLALLDADVKLDDAKTGLKTEMDHLEWHVFDLGLSRPVRTELKGEIEGRLGRTLKLEGPLVLKAAVEPSGPPGRWEALRAKVELQAGDIHFELPGWLKKSKGDPARLEMDLEVSPQELKVARLDLSLLNVRASGRAVMSRAGGGSAIRAELTAKPIELKEWPRWVPMLKEYDLGGALAFDAKVEGPADRYGYRANLRLQNVTAKAPKLKGQPRIDGELVLATDQVERLDLTLAAPGADLRLTGKVSSFAKPRFDLDVQSKGLDIDKLMDLPPPAKSAEGASGSAGRRAGSEGKSAESASGGGLDASVDSIRGNPALAGASGTIRARVDHLVVRETRLDQIASVLTCKDLVLALERLDFRIWKGKVGASFKADLKPKAPAYSFSAKVEGLDMKSAVESQYALFKNTLLGQATFEVNGSGASFDARAAKRNLRMKGKAQVLNPVFQTIDIAKVAREAINGAILKAASTVPALRGKELQPIPGGASKYDYFGGELEAGGGVFRMPSFQARSAPGQGLDLSGRVAYGLLDDKLDADVVIIDAHDLTGGKKLGADVPECHVEHVIAEGNGPVKIPVHAGCTLASPCVDSVGVASYFAKVAADNVAACYKAAAGRKASEAVRRAVPGAPPAVQKGLDDLQKRFFGQ